MPKKKTVGERRGDRTSAKTIEAGQPPVQAGVAAPKKRGRKAAEVPRALQDEIVEAKGLLAKATAGDTEARYKVARIVRRVQTDPRKYGKNAVGALERHLKIGAKTLFRYAAVPEAWDEARFKELATRRTPAGATLGWSMFLALAEEKDGRRRNALAQKAVEEGLSVRAVRNAVAGTDGDKETAPAESVTAAAVRAERLDAVLGAVAEVLGAVEDPADDETLATAARRCALALERLVETAPAVIERLREVAPEDEAQEEEGSLD